MASKKRKTEKSEGPAPSVKTAKPGRVPLPIQGFEPASFAATTDELSSRLADMARHTSMLRKACDAIHSDGPLAILSRTDASGILADGAEALVVLLAPLKTTLDAMLARLNEWRQAERNSRRSRFDEGAKARQLTLAGSWPEPVVNGIVFVVIDEAKDRATVNGRAVRAIPTAERLLDASQEALVDLEQHRTDPAAFVAALWKAFRGCGGQAGTGVGVFDLLAKFTWERQSKSFVRDPRTELFRGYGVTQFRADLTHYLGAGAPPFRDGKTAYRLEVVGGSFSQDGIFMYFPQSQRLGTCGRLTFQCLGEGEQP